MRWSVSLQAEGDLVIGLEEVVELADPYIGIVLSGRDLASLEKLADRLSALR